jgi:hypothetical protein
MEPNTIQTPPAKPNWTPPPALKAGTQMKLLKQFMFECQWTGKVQAGGMGQGSPEMQGIGKASFKPMMGGLWLVGDFEQNQFVNGQLLIVWKMHFIVGWNEAEQRFKIALVDNNGTAALMSGRIEDKRFIAQNSPNAPVRLELVWELLEDGSVRWTNHCSVQPGSWFLVEEYLCRAV